MEQEAEKPMVRKIRGEFSGDDAIDLNILETALGMKSVSKSKAERESLLIKAAIYALSLQIAQYRDETGVKHPDFHELVNWMREREVD